MGQMNRERLSRRRFLGTAGAAVSGAGLSACSVSPSNQARPVGRLQEEPGLRIAHLTDIHVQPQRGAAEGMAACLHHVQGAPEKPDFILNGGDCVMDVLAADRSRAKVQWDLWKRVLRSECSLPIIHCIGNHDIWGWDTEKSGTTGEENRYGKKWAAEVFELERLYYSFDRGGWHFVVLDSMMPGPKAYIARIDERQFEWLEQDLSAVQAGTPTVIVSHIPILAACAYYDGENEESGDWIVPGRWMHIDSRRIKDLFLKHPNVTLCLSGHIHLRDRVDYNGVVYLCNGAVSGGWWKGPYQECEPGYALIDLHKDGSFGYRYIEYGWVPKA